MNWAAPYLDARSWLAEFARAAEFGDWRQALRAHAAISDAMEELDMILRTKVNEREIGERQSRPDLRECPVVTLDQADA